MSELSVDANYSALVDVTSAVGQVGSVLYWDDTAATGQFRAVAFIDGGRSTVVYLAGGLASPPATFLVDFPNAIAISGSFHIT